MTALDRFKEQTQGQLPAKPKTWLEALDHHGVTPEYLISSLVAIAEAGMLGYVVEKATSKGEIVAVTEKDLKTAIAAMKELARIRAIAEPIAQSQSLSLDINIVQARPAPKPALAPEKDPYDFI